MARELKLSLRPRLNEAAFRDPGLSGAALPVLETQSLSSCEHRTVSRDGRIVCSRIVEGDDEVSPNVCRSCPFKAVNCSHLRFSLRLTSPSPLIVRYNGRTEIWDNGSAELGFERAACLVRVAPVHDPRSCAGCALRAPLQAPVEQARPRREVAGLGKVVPFPSREALAPTG
jgi:hypothetical protein